MEVEDAGFESGVLAITFTAGMDLAVAIKINCNFILYYDFSGIRCVSLF